MKRYLYLYIYIVFGMLLTGCHQQPKKFVIGVSQCSEDIWRDKLNDELKMGEYLNDSIIVKLASSNDDNVLQNKQVNQFIDEGVDLLIVSPNQLSAISKSVERAYDKGIPVILYDRKTNSDKYTAFIGCDNYTIGKSMGTLSPSSFRERAASLKSAVWRVLRLLWSVIVVLWMLSSLILGYRL